MQAQNTIPLKPSIISRLVHLQTGDFVLVWDGAKERNIWQRVAELKEVRGRLKIRVERTDFFFDESLVVSFVSLKLPQVSETMPVSFFTDEEGTLCVFGPAPAGMQGPQACCQSCAQPTRHFFNVGTAQFPLYVCYYCRFERSNAA